MLYTPQSLLPQLIHQLSLPSSSTTLSTLVLPALQSPCQGLPSSYPVGVLAQTSISLSGLIASLIYAFRTGKDPEKAPQVTVPLKSALAEFVSERLCFQNDKGVEFKVHPIGGLHPCKNGRYVRIHDGWPHHRVAALKVLGLNENANREKIDEHTKEWDAKELESEGIKAGAVIGMARTREEWETITGKSKDDPVDLPVRIEPLGLRSSTDIRRRWWIVDSQPDKPLRGLRVLDLTRVLAGPVAGRTLAAHGAEVLWITSPNLPPLPEVDRDTARGKKSVHLDLKDESDLKKFWELVKEADVILQAYRPDAFAGLGITVSELTKVNPGIVIAVLSAYGGESSSFPPSWAKRRGFDSIVQTVTGMNISEAEHFSSPSSTSGDESSAGIPSGYASSVARPLPCQALDHGSGYFLASGVMAALYHQMTSKLQPWLVTVTLAGTMEYLHSLGQLPGRTGFEPEAGLIDLRSIAQSKDDDVLETSGEWKYVRHAVSIEGVKVGWDNMPTPPGSNEPKWS